MSLCRPLHCAPLNVAAELAEGTNQRILNLWIKQFDNKNFKISWRNELSESRNCR